MFDLLQFDKTSKLHLNIFDRIKIYQRLEIILE